MNQRLASCILKKGRKMVGTPQCNNNEIPKDDPDLGSSHAEMATVSQFLSMMGIKIKCCDKYSNMIDSTIKKELNKYDVAVIRIGNMDPNKITLVNARPCYKCLNVLKMCGFKRIHYSDDTGNIVTETVKNMLAVHSSYVTIKLFFLKNNMNYINSMVHNTTYYDDIIRKQIPEIVRELNFRYFIQYDFKSIAAKYKMVKKIVNGTKLVTIYNSNNHKIKSIVII
jgi:tRNA(Arg) A34 adenosine deaminase TadA